MAQKNTRSSLEKKLGISPRGTPEKSGPKKNLGIGSPRGRARFICRQNRKKGGSGICDSC